MYELHAHSMRRVDHQPEDNKPDDEDVRKNAWMRVLDVICLHSGACFLLGMPQHQQLRCLRAHETSGPKVCWYSAIVFDS